MTAKANIKKNRKSFGKLRTGNIKAFHKNNSERLKFAKFQWWKIA